MEAMGANQHLNQGLKMIRARLEDCPQEA